MAFISIGEENISDHLACKHTENTQRVVRGEVNWLFNVTIKAKLLFHTFVCDGRPASPRPIYFYMDLIFFRIPLLNTV